MTTPDARGLALRARAMAKFRREVGSPMLTEMADALDALSAENESLRERLSRSVVRREPLGNRLFGFLC